MQTRSRHRDVREQTTADLQRRFEGERDRGAAAVAAASADPLRTVSVTMRRSPRHLLVTRWIGCSCCCHRKTGSRPRRPHQQRADPAMADSRRRRLLRCDCVRAACARLFVVPAVALDWSIGTVLPDPLRSPDSSSLRLSRPRRQNRVARLAACRLLSCVAASAAASAGTAVCRLIRLRCENSDWERHTRRTRRRCDREQRGGGCFKSEQQGGQRRGGEAREEASEGREEGRRDAPVLHTHSFPLRGESENTLLQDRWKTRLLREPSALWRN